MKIYQVEIIENSQGLYVARAYLQAFPDGGDYWGLPFKGIKEAALNLFGKMMIFHDHFKLLIPATEYSSAVSYTYGQE